MARDAMYDDLSADYLVVFERYTAAVDKLIALQTESDHRSFARAALLTRALADQVKTAREAAEAHRHGL